MLHHVCGEHEWVDGECSHGHLTAQEEGKPPLEKDSKPHKAVREVVLDKMWLKSLEFYIRFR